MAEPVVTTKTQQFSYSACFTKIGRLDCTCGYQCRDYNNDFTVVCLVTSPMNASKAGGDLALIQTSLLSHLNANLLA